MIGLPAPTEEGLLAAWEYAGDGPPAARAALLAAALSGLDADHVGDMPVGNRDELLLAARVACFGDEFAGTAECPGCGEVLDVVVSAGELPAPAGNGGPKAVDVDGSTVRYRPLTTNDLLAVDRRVAPARRDLLLRCVDAGSATLPDGLEQRLLDALPRLLAEADPLADATVPLTCAECGHAWSSPVDVAAHVLADVDRWVADLLGQVHALATAYGWREQDVLALSPRRRRYYLEASGR